VLRRFLKGWATGVLWSLVALTLVLCAGPAANAAGPAQSATSVPVLIVDGGVGDAPAFIGYWLRPDASEVAERGGGRIRLWTSPRPGWWTGGDAPPTYLLAATDADGKAVDGGLGAADIAWGLDRIDRRHPGARVMVVSQGAAGLQLRAYLQDVVRPRQSDRADVAGAVLIGCPNKGLPLQRRFPGLDLWREFAAGARLAPTDLLPGSAYLAGLNAGGRPLPRVCRIAVVQGLPAHLTKPGSDGVVQFARLAGSVVGSPVTYVTTSTSASEALDLPAAWRSLTIAGGAPTDQVRPLAVAKLQALEGYASSPLVRSSVQKLYEGWFSQGPPVTHISTRLVIDSSGSMAGVWSATTKIDAARRASRDFTSACESSRRLADSAPEDIGLITFADEATMTVAPGGSFTAVTARLARIRPQGNTDVGEALRLAVGSFRASPRAATKSILLVSDGVNTAGLDKDAILSGPVKSARRKGVRIDTIAVGSVAQADRSFLERVSRATGGRSSVAGDLFALRTDFLRARVSAGAELVFDEAVDPREASATPVTVAEVSFATRRLDVMVVPEGRAGRWFLLRDGRRVKAPGGRTRDGVTWFALTSPTPGEYSVAAASGSRASTVRVLAAMDTDAFAVASSAGVAAGTFPWLIVLGVAGAAACVITVLISRRHPQAQKGADA